MSFEVFSSLWKRLRGNVTCRAEHRTQVYSPLSSATHQSDCRLPLGSQQAQILHMHWSHVGNQVKDSGNHVDN